RKILFNELVPEIDREFTCIPFPEQVCYFAVGRFQFGEPQQQHPEVSPIGSRLRLSASRLVRKDLAYDQLYGRQYVDVLDRRGLWQNVFDPNVDKMSVAFASYLVDPEAFILDLPCSDRNAESLSEMFPKFLRQFPCAR